MMSGPIGRIVRLREGEAATAALMFGYSFLAMTSYNILRPITRSRFIAELGADNLPYVQLAAGLVIGVLMQAYSHAIARLPRPVVIPATQAGLAGCLVLFWALFRAGVPLVSPAFYVFGLIIGILLISQFWTLANDIYDPRQAKRLFGLIGGGASLGGATGAIVTRLTVQEVGTANLLLVSAGVLLVCTAVVVAVERREPVGEAEAPDAEGSRVGGGEALQLLRSSRHLQVIAVVIGATAVGSTIIDQQLNMAAAEQMGADATDAITGFLAEVMAYISIAGFVIQVGLTSRIHRALGIGFAMLMLPVSLGATATVILLSGALWAAAGARVLDTSLRYTVDKTTREILFMPLPADLKYRAKPFVDVTVDRLAKALAAVLLLVLIKPWGLGLDWRGLSFASLAVMGGWIAVALVARREYLATFRRSLGAREVEPAGLRLEVADASTVEAIQQELSSDDEDRVLYAIDMLEALDRRDLVTRLLLHHDSPRVRARALRAIDASTAEAAPWLDAVERMLGDEDADVRAAAVQLMARARHADASALMRPYLGDADPRVAVTAAVALAGSSEPADVEAGRAALTRITGVGGPEGVRGRLAAATALGRDPIPGLQPLLVTLMHDADLDVARAAILSVARAGAVAPLFVPALVSLLGDRRLKPVAREALAGAGDGLVDGLTHFLHAADEQLWVRRHIPATLAQIPTQRAMDALFTALGVPDGFLRFKAIEATERMRGDHPALAIDRDLVERQVLRETARYFDAVTLGYNLVRELGGASDVLVVRALEDRRARTRDRLFRLLGLLHDPTDVAAARHSIEHGDARARAGAVEYLDNLLTGTVRKRVLPMIEGGSEEEQAKAANRALRTRPRDLEDTLAQLVHDDDEVVAAAAIALIVQRGLTALAGDLDFVAAHAPVGSHAGDAARWGRAVLSGTEGNVRTTVAMAERLSALPLFAFVSVDELFRIAAAGRQLDHHSGEVVSGDDESPGVLLFLLDGQVETSGPGDGPEHQFRGPATLVFEEALGGAPAGRVLRASGPGTSLAVERETFLAMLADSMPLAQGLFRTVFAGSAERRRRAGRARPGSSPRSDGPLRPIDAVLALRRCAWLSGASVEQVLDVGAVVREVPLVVGAELFGAGTPPAIHHVLAGEVRVEHPGGDAQAVPAGDTAGVAETLAGEVFGGRAVVTIEGRALVLHRDRLYDAFDEHPDLLESVFRGVLRDPVDGA